MARRLWRTPSASSPFVLLSLARLAGLIAVGSVALCLLSVAGREWWAVEAVVLDWLALLWCSGDEQHQILIRPAGIYPTLYKR